MHDIGKPGYVSRLGLEIYTTRECLHGVVAKNVTVFPQSITLASSWNVDLIHEVAEAIGNEARALRNKFELDTQLPNRTLPPPSLTCFSPQINIVRDPRWGRAQETYGESPFLTKMIASEYVKGLQGDKHYLRAVATPKHFNAYGGATTRGQRSPTEVTLSWRDWMETFLPAFQVVISEARAESTMCSYNTLCVVDSYSETCPGPSHGVPACASNELLTTILRKNWGFKGYVIGDAGAIKFIQTDHEWATSQEEAATDAIKAGADMALGGGCNPKNVPPGCISFAAIPNATAHGLISETDVDKALSRILRARFRLGLMDPDELNPYNKIKANVIDSWNHRSLALKAAQEGIVLLMNKNEILPINNNNNISVAVIGPNALVKPFGNYNGDNNNFTNLLDGIRRWVPGAIYAKGCDIASSNRSGFSEAIEAAAGATVTIAIMGIDQSQEHETGTRKNITLPGVQTELLKALKATQTQLIVVLVGGSAIAVPWVKNNIDGLIYAGYGGEEAGSALADILFGAVNPSGRLPITFYKSKNQLPPFVSYQMDGPPYGRTFRYLTDSPLFYFGYGLSYTRFVYSNMTVTTQRKGSIPVCSSVNISISITNVGDIPGDEVVQLYVKLIDTRSIAPQIALAGFSRTGILIPLTQSFTSMQFSITPPMMSVVVPEKRAGWTWQPGKLQLWIGGRQPTIDERNDGASNDILTTTLVLEGPETPLEQC